MEYHMEGSPEQISRYVFCPGSQRRARRIADHFEDLDVVSEGRGIVVYSGTYRGHFLTSCGTGMGGPAAAIACEELAHLGADTFIRVGSCGVFQEGQAPGDIIAASGSYRGGGTGDEYLPVRFPAVSTFHVLREIVRASEKLDIPLTVGVGCTLDAFYATRGEEAVEAVAASGGVFIEMECDTLFLVGARRGWRTGALFTSDGAPGEIKPEWGQEDFQRGEKRMIKIALEAMISLAEADSVK
jgi:uridine phosphorylase